MSSNLFMDFTVDKETHTVKITRAFNASQPMVWATWTEAELLDQWWAPRPWKSVTQSMDFRDGGRRLYYMAGPEGEQHWALADFKNISPKDSFGFLDAFCDPKGNISEEMPRSDWSVKFSEKDGVTTVYIEIKHQKLEDLKKIISMGFKEGFIMALSNLDEVLVKS